MNFRFLVTVTLNSVSSDATNWAMLVFLISGSTSKGVNIRYRMVVTLPPELWRLLVSEDTYNYQNGCGPQAVFK